MQSCATRLGYDLDYDPQPTLATYRSCLGLAAFIGDGIARLDPRDNIDIQSFMYVVAGEGYAAEDKSRQQ